MASYRLRKKIERMEAFLAVAAPFEQRVRRLAGRLHEDPKPWLAALKGRAQELPESLLSADGMLEWPALQSVIELRYGKGTTLSSLPESWTSQGRAVRSSAPEQEACHE
jgi:hypothetical protein